VGRSGKSEFWSYAFRIVDTEHGIHQRIDIYAMFINRKWCKGSQERTFLQRTWNLHIREVEIGNGMSVVGGVESIKCSVCPVAGGRGDERIMRYSSFCERLLWRRKRRGADCQGG